MYIGLGLQRVSDLMTRRELRAPTLLLLPFRDTAASEATNFSIMMQAKPDRDKPLILERRLKECFYFFLLPH